MFPTLMPSTPPHSPSQRDLRSPATPFNSLISIGGLRVIVLFVLDAIALYVAWSITERLSTPGAFWTLDHSAVLVPMLGIELGVLTTGGFYQAGIARRNYPGLVRALTIATLLLGWVTYFYQPSRFISRSQFLLYWAFSVALVLAERRIVDQILRLLRRQGFLRYAAVLIADDRESPRATQLIYQENRYNLVAILNARSLDPEQRQATFTLMQHLKVSEVFVPWEIIKDHLFLCWQFQAFGVKVNVLPVGLESLFQASKFWSMRGFPALIFSPPTVTGKDFWVKRVFDVGVAGLLLLVLSPLLLIIALWIKMDSSGSIFYKQIRIGLQGKPFKVLKFRTMVANAENLQQQLEAYNEMKDGVLFKLQSDPRITNIGQFLRRTSLDELPQLINVIRGEMSLVGPRPLPIRDVERFEEHHFLRHEVLPGITGLWQISGRSNITNFEDVIHLDLTYIRTWSLWLDFSILLKTIRVVLQRKGAY